MNDLIKNDLKNIIIEKIQDKRIRKHNAIKLPDTLLDLNIPKYINYYNECYNYEQKLYREYFKIEKHPYQKKNKTYISSKSNKVSIVEKLNQITKILDGLSVNDTSANITSANITSANITSANITSANITSDNITSANITSANITSANITSANITNIIKLPKYISIKNHETNSDKYYLTYDKKHKHRNTLQVLCNKSVPISQSLKQFLEKISLKFDT
jgi:hypothetical protein